MPASAQEASLSSKARDEARSSKIGQQLITLISFTATPGVSGAKFKVSRDDGDPDYDLSKLNIGGGKALPIDGFAPDLYVEGGIGYLKTDENSFGRETVDNSKVLAKTDRKVYSGRLGVGLSWTFAEHFRVTPILRGAISKFDNETGLGELDENGGTPDDIINLDWKLWAASVGGALELGYDRLYQGRRIELKGSYTHVYTNVFDAPSSRLEFSGHNDIVTLLGRLTTPTGRRPFGRPLFWNIFSTATQLAGDGKDALGFSHFAEFGAGLDLDLGEDDLPVVKALRARASIIVGKDVTGYKLGISFGF
jgi:hypothetical protein